MKIKSLKLYTKYLSQQIEFYNNVLGVHLVETSEKHAIFQVGKTKLTLEESDLFRPYHFAINISSHKELEALDWLKNRLEVLTFEGHEVQDFINWNAKAIYFYDKDKNIVEFIARKNILSDNKNAFSSADLLEISEIGLPVDNIESTYRALAHRIPLKIFDGGFGKFCAIGDEHGLFICINKEKKNWFPTGDKAFSSGFEIRFSEKRKEYSVKFKDGAINII